MDVEAYFKEMFHCIWQSQDLERFDEFYSKDFTETICVSDSNNEPLEFCMDYEELWQQAKKQKEDYQDTTFEIKKIVSDGKGHISVNFYSTSIVRETKEVRHRLVCGIWHLNKEDQIDQVWAVVTPYYPE